MCLDFESLFVVLQLAASEIRLETLPLVRQTESVSPKSPVYFNEYLKFICYRSRLVILQFSLFTGNDIAIIGEWSLLSSNFLQVRAGFGQSDELVLATVPLLGHGQLTLLRGRIVGHDQTDVRSRRLH